MISLIAASAFFLLIHFAVSGTRLRDALVGRMGEGPYRGAFVVASFVGIIWMSIAWRRAPIEVLWPPLPQLLPVAIALVFIAFLFVVIGIATPAPTGVRGESRLAQGADAARGVIRITRHPFLWGAALWALVHTVMNGELSSLIFFGSFLVLALFGTRSIDAKRKRLFGAQWDAFARATSNVPFAAIASGRNHLGPALREIGVWRPLLAIAIFAAVLIFHGRIFGPPLV